MTPDCQHLMQEIFKEMPSTAPASLCLFDSTLALLALNKHRGLWHCARLGCRVGRSREARTPAMRAKRDCIQAPGRVTPRGACGFPARRLRAPVMPSAGLLAASRLARLAGHRAAGTAATRPARREGFHECRQGRERRVGLRPRLRSVQQVGCGGQRQARLGQ